MNRRHPAGFLLIELVVVVFLVALVLTFLVTTRRPKSNDENQVVCTNVLKTLMSASSAYAHDNGTQLPHGMNNPWVPNDFFGTSYYAQSVLAPAQACGIGLLMNGNYVPEKREAISCPQTDAREDKGFNQSLWMPTVDYTSKQSNDASDRSLIQGLDKNSALYYRNIKTMTRQYTLISTYGIRGPSLKIDALTKTIGGKEVPLVPVEMAWFADHEGADQKLIPEIEKNGKKPIDGWGRVHPAGINVGYVDGHVALFMDEDRSKTYNAGEARYYGNSCAIEAYDLDRQ